MLNVALIVSRNEDARLQGMPLQTGDFAITAVCVHWLLEVPEV